MSDLEQIFGPHGAMETYEAAKKAGQLRFMHASSLHRIEPSWIGSTAIRPTLGTSC